MISTLFDVILPAFIIIGIGASLGRAFSPHLSSLNRVALYGAVPALVFNSMSTTTLEFADAWVLFAGNALFVFAIGVLAWLGSWRFPADARRGVIATSMFSNAANMMLPVTLFAFGDAGLQRALAMYVFSAILLFTVGPLVLGGGSAAPKARRRLLLGVLRLPVLWAAFLGVLVNLLSLPIPLGFDRGIALLSEAAIPLVLLTLGVQMQQAGLRLPSAVNLYGAAVKLLVGPLVAFAAALLVGARGIDLGVLTLLGAMPPAVNNFMLAMEFGADAKEVAGTVIVSTLSALATLSVVVYLLQTYVYPGV